MITIAALSAVGAGFNGRSFIFTAATERGPPGS
jgi:hypothetical protein